MILYHASPFKLDTIRKGSYWATARDDALDFGMSWDNRGCWLYTTRKEHNGNDWIYSGIIDEDLGGTTKMYRNRVDTKPETTEWVDWIDHYGGIPAFANSCYVRHEGALYKKALPYQLRPAIPARLQLDALAAEKWAKEFKDEKPLKNLGEYMSRMDYEASSLLDSIEYLSRFRLQQLQEDEELFRHPDGSLNIAKYDDHIYDHLKHMDRYLGYVQRHLKNFAETLADYIDLPGFDYHKPLDVTPEQLQDFNTYYDDYKANIVPALNVAAQLDKATQALAKYTEFKMADIERRVQERKHESPYATEKIYPEGLQPLEIMYHVTTAYSKVLAEGIKSKRQLLEESKGERPVGLGGGQDEEVSFTASLEFAEGIKEDLLGMIALAQTEHTLRDVLAVAADWGLSEQGIAQAIRTYEAVKPAAPLGDLDDVITFNQSRWLYDYLRSEASSQGLVYYAAFWAPDLETFAKVDPKEVQIVEAVVDTTSERTRYLKHEEEWRIPPENILSIGSVGSQQKVLENLRSKRSSAVIHHDEVYLLRSNAKTRSR